MTEEQERLRHIKLEGIGNAQGYRRPRRNIDGLPSPDRNWPLHGRYISDSYNHAIESASHVVESSLVDMAEAAAGLYLTFELLDRPDTPLESLESKRKGILLLSISETNEEGMVRAIVFVPRGQEAYFADKINEYLDDEKITAKGNRANQPLIDSIENIGAGNLTDLWRDPIEIMPTPGELFWWEVWVATTLENAFDSALQRLGLPSGNKVRFFERVVIPVCAIPEVMQELCYLSGAVAELRKHRAIVSTFVEMSTLEQKEWVEDLKNRLNEAHIDSPYVCLLDTGVNCAHPLLQSSLAEEDCHACDPDWPIGDGLPVPHGTGMAGLSLLGDISDHIVNNDSIDLTHRLESIRIIPPTGRSEQESYGWITSQAVSRAEVENAERRRVYCMAITSDEISTAGKPSSWSSEIDTICYGENNQERLFFISGGNVFHQAPIEDYLTNNTLTEIEDPAQAWNALTVGGYTEKLAIEDVDLAGYQPLAMWGELSPNSSTSSLWSDSWPTKPDILMEGGNWAINPDNSLWTKADDLSLLTTSHLQDGKLLQAFDGTSAATALAAKMAAHIWSEYPDYWPETIRGLLVHSADWKEPVRNRFDEANKTRRRGLMKIYGYGVPDVNRAMWCAQNDLTLIIEDEVTPFSNNRANEMMFYPLPWPKEVLQELGETIIELRVTISYFIEPNPSARGYHGRYVYQSHGLRFDIPRPNEPFNDFVQRINEAAQEDEYSRPDGIADAGWYLGVQARDRGSIHSDLWIGRAADLAERGAIVVYPVSGWWKTNREKQDSSSRYSLLVSLRTPEITAELYNAVLTEIEAMAAIEIEV